MKTNDQIAGRIAGRHLNKLTDEVGFQSLKSEILDALEEKDEKPAATIMELLQGILTRLESIDEGVNK